MCLFESQNIFVQIAKCIRMRGSGRVSEGVKDAYTSADTLALKRTGIQTNRQAAYIHIIPPRLETKSPLSLIKHH